MPEKCQCESCSSRNNYEKDIDKKKVSWFKENIVQSRDISSKAIEGLSTLGKKTRINQFFRITLSEYNEEQKYMRELSRLIDNFDFTMLMDEFFALDSDDIDVDDSDYDDNIRVFKSLDEVIDFLQQRNQEDEQ